MARPIPLFGRVQGHLIVYKGGRRRYAQARKQALANDGVIDLTEARELLRIVEQEVFAGGDELAKDGGTLCTSIRHISQVLTGAEGMDSICAVRSWEERQAARMWEEDNDPPPAASMAIAA